MQKYIERILNDHEANNPNEKHWNDMAIEDMHSNNELHPTRPMIMHAAYGLDGHADRRNIFGGNYDKISSDDKHKIHDDLVNMAEVSSMLDHPEAIFDSSGSGEISESRQLARDVLEHLAETHDSEKLYKELQKELMRPLMDTLLHNAFDKQSILHGLLHPTMVRQTEHEPHQYGQMLNHLLLQPALESLEKEKWKKALPEIFHHMRQHNG